MARLLVVLAEPATPLPPALTVLPHALTVVEDADDALSRSAEAQAVIVDARKELPWARSTCQIIAAAAGELRLLALVSHAGLSAITPEWGVHDFVLEDASAGEWDARIRLGALARPASTVITGGAISLDEAAYTATAGSAPLDLTYTEFELLKFLMLHPGRVLTREHLLSEVWGYDYYGGTRTVDVHIRRLRAKLGPEYDKYIGTVRNVGYRFSS